MKMEETFSTKKGFILSDQKKGFMLRVIYFKPDSKLLDWLLGRLAENASIDNIG